MEIKAHNAINPLLTIPYPLPSPPSPRPTQFKVEITFLD